MKFLTVSLLLFFTIISINNAFTVEEDEAWNEFKLEHNKLFLSKNKENDRKNSFLANRAHMLKLQATHDTGDLTYTPKLYSHADLTNEEFTSRYGGFDYHEPKFDVERKNYTPNAQQSLPLNFDSRYFGWIGPVKQQGQCQSCWAFSALSCIEAGLEMKWTDVEKDAKRVNLDLAEQQLVDCAKNGGDGCDRGTLELAFNYLTKSSGAVNENLYPYTGRFGQCKTFEEGVKVGGTTYLMATKDAIKAALMEHGSLAIAVDCGPWQFYGQGIFHGDKGNPPNHAVNLVGWGVEGDQEYWLIRNSWGEQFGEKGYIRVRTTPDGGYNLKYTWAVKW